MKEKGYTELLIYCGKILIKSLSYSSLDNSKEARLIKRRSDNVSQILEKLKIKYNGN